MSLCVLRVLAMLLIINSHSDVLFPSKISFLASGGAIGNELFFLISGFLFTAKGKFGGYLRKRFVRLYVPTYIVTIVLLVLTVYPIQDVLSLSGIIQYFVWPTKFWFVSSIFVFGLILFFLSQTSIFESFHKFVVYIIVIMSINVLVYLFLFTDKDVWMVEDFRLPGAIPFKSIYSFMVFSCGYYIRINEEKIISKTHGCLSATICIISIALFYGFKLLLNKSVVPMQLQIISQPLTIICVLSIFLCVKRDHKIEKWLQGRKYKNALYMLSCVTLESYLVQIAVIEKISNLHLFFPLGYLFSLSTILLCSFLLHFLVETIINNPIISKI